MTNKKLFGTHEKRRIKKVFRRGDYAGKWIDADTNKLSVEKPSNPLGLCVDITTDEKEPQLVLITDVVGPTSFRAVRDLCKTNIGQLAVWKNEIVTFTKDLIKKYGWIRIWSTTLWKSTSFYRQGPYHMYIYYLHLYPGGDGISGCIIDNDYHLFALKTKTFPISKLSK